MVIGFIDHSQVVTATKYTLAGHSTLNPLSVLSLVFTIRFLATDLSQSHCSFEHHCYCCTSKVFNSHTQSSWLSLIPSTADSLNSDLRLFSRAEQSRSLLPTISRHGHSWHRAPVGPVAIYLLYVETFVFFFSFVDPPQ
jgi:hypothetical protein